MATTVQDGIPRAQLGVIKKNAGMSWINVDQDKISIVAQYGLGFVDIDGPLSARRVVITGTDAVQHLVFSRSGPNYITAPDGYIAIGSDVGLANCALLIENNAGRVRVGSSLDNQRNLVVYGDAIIYGNITNATITSSTVNINASLLTSGTLPAARLPNHSASLLTSGTLPAARLPTTITGNKTFSGSTIVIQGTLFYTGISTTTNSANMHIFDGGLVAKSTSSRKYKQDIGDYTSLDILKARPVRFRGIADVERDPNAPYNLGFIAEEMDEAGLTELVTYNEDGSPEAVNYDRVCAALLVVIKDQESRITALENKLKEISI